MIDDVMNILEKVPLMVRLAIRARRAKTNPNSSRIIGLNGRAVTMIAPFGTVFLRNELWRARASVDVMTGENVRVIGLAGLTLDVAPVRDNFE